MKHRPALALAVAVTTTLACSPTHEMTPDEVARVLGAAPEQVRIPEAEPIVWEWDDSTVTIEPLFDYHLLGRVMSAEGYWLDDEARYSPVDVLVCWGPPADPRYDGQIRWSQHGRFGNYRYPRMPAGLTAQLLRTQCANTHLVPADGFVEDEIEDIRRGDVVEIRGKLVNLREEWHDGRWFEWRTSVTREDDGGGACELLLVEEVTIN